MGSSPSLVTAVTSQVRGVQTGREPAPAWAVLAVHIRGWLVLPTEGEAAAPPR